MHLLRTSNVIHFLPQLACPVLSAMLPTSSSYTHAVMCYSSSFFRVRGQAPFYPLASTPTPLQLRLLVRVIPVFILHAIDQLDVVLLCLGWGDAVVDDFLPGLALCFALQVTSSVRILDQ